jgi:hypothetical protein
MEEGNNRGTSMCACYVVVYGNKCMNSLCMEPDNGILRRYVLFKREGHPEFSWSPVFAGFSVTCPLSCAWPYVQCERQVVVRDRLKRVVQSSMRLERTRLCIWERKTGCMLWVRLPMPVAVLPWDAQP